MNNNAISLEKKYKGYKYIVYVNGDVYFRGSRYITIWYKDLQKYIKKLISEINNKYNDTKDYYYSVDYCNGLINKVKEGV